ncbi:MAG TPA: signal peptidase II [Mariprofundaceae bacterium]|nr:signal peptidase II [Mariprofundaceae bacterium]
MISRTQGQIGLFVLLLAIDQLSKWWIRQPDFHPIVVIDGFFNIVRAFNTGVAFSIFADLPETWRAYFLLGITIGIAFAVLFWWLKERTHQGLTSWLLVLILAGAAGNIWDRAQLGYVVDFIQWYVVIGGKAYTWPAFNIADSCISVAVVLLLITSLRKR